MGFAKILSQPSSSHVLASIASRAPWAHSTWPETCPGSIPSCIQFNQASCSIWIRHILASVPSVSVTRTSRLNYRGHIGVLITTKRSMLSGNRVNKEMWASFVISWENCIVETVGEPAALMFCEVSFAVFLWIQAFDGQTGGLSLKGNSSETVHGRSELLMSGQWGDVPCSKAAGREISISSGTLWLSLEIQILLTPQSVRMKYLTMCVCCGCVSIQSCQF